MNREIVGKIFPRELSYIVSKKCPFCKTTISNLSDFRDSLSLKEFEISGLCQACQDMVFNDNPNEDYRKTLGDSQFDQWDRERYE